MIRQQGTPTFRGLFLYGRRLGWAGGYIENDSVTRGCIFFFFSYVKLTTRKYIAKKKNTHRGEKIKSPRLSNGDSSNYHYRYKVLNRYKVR